MTDVACPAPPVALGARAARTWGALAVVCAAAFVVVLDFFIVNVALPSVQTDLRASSGAIEWVVAGYALALAVGLVAGGRLGDRYGRRRTFCVALAAFTLASAGCGLAPTTALLVAGRVVQGAAAALLTPQVLAIIGVTYEGPARLRALGVYGTVMGLAAVSGQLVGGVLVAGGAGWRGCFLINVPIGLVTLVAARRHVAESRVPGAARPDAAGTALLAAALVALLLPLVEGRQSGWPAWAWASLAAAPVLAGAFALQQAALGRRGGAPLLDPALLRAGVFAKGLAAQFALWCGQAAFFLFLALYLQQGRGLSAMEAGLVFVVVALPYVVVAARTPALVARFGRLVLVAGGIAMALGHGASAVAVNRWGVGGPIEALVPGLVLVGLGTGLCIPALMGLLLAEVAPGQAGNAGAVLSTVQHLGNAVGVAVTGVVFFGARDAGFGAAFSLSAAQLVLVGLAVALLALPLRR